MTELLIIADDLTGALDSSVAFVDAGVEVYPLAGQGPTADDLASGPRVVAVNAATRHMLPADAATTVAGLVGAAKQAGVRVVLKKTDSALRGNVGAELAAAQAVFGGTLHFVPAFPAMGRVTLDGVQLIDGVPVAGTSFGRDPFEPVRESAVLDLIAEQSKVAGFTVALGKSAPEGFEGIAVYDSDDQDGLDALAERLLGEGPVLLAGCAGLSQAVAGALGCSPREAKLPEGNLLALCGSVNPASIDQCLFASRAGAPRYVVGEDEKKDADWARSGSFGELVRWAQASWRANALSVVDASAYTPAADGSLPAPAVRDRIATNLGVLAAAICGGAPAGASLLVMGGDVLLALVSAAGARTLGILGEVTTGVVASELRLAGRTLCVMSKSGGFGDEGLFLRVSERLRSREGELVTC